MTSILLVYEQLPESTIILLIGDSDLAAAKISEAEIKNLHGVYSNTTGASKVQEKVHEKLYAAIFGLWDDEKDESGPALWKDRIVFQSDLEDEEANPGLPPTLNLGEVIIVHTGTVL